MFVEFVSVFDQHNLMTFFPRNENPILIFFFFLFPLNLFVAGTKYKPIFEETSYKVVMRLVIKNVTSKDYGAYKCISKNSLGDTEGSMKLYRGYRNLKLYKNEPSKTSIFFFLYPLPPQKKKLCLLLCIQYDYLLPEREG